MYARLPCCWLLLALLAGGGAVCAQQEEGTDAPTTIRLKLEEACTLRVLNGEIVLDSRLRGARVPRQEVIIEDLGGATYMELRPGMYRFDHYSSDERMTIHVENRGDRISIEYSSPGYRISYSQSGEGRNGWGYKEAGITIYDSDGIYKGSVTAADFATLRKEHPVEVMQYMAPMLRQMRARGFFADVRIARQVLAAEPAGSARDVGPLVARLVKELDADSFKDREKAQRQLGQVGPVVVPILEQWDRSKLSPQQQTEIDAFLHARLGSKQLQELRGDAGYLLDCLYLDDAKLRASALELLRSEFKAELALDPSSDLLAKAAEIEALRARLKLATRPAGQ